MCRFYKDFVTLPLADVTLRILATTDLHAHVMPWDYRADAPLAEVGLAALAASVAAAKSGCANCLLLDNGDFLQGSPLGDWQAEHPGTDHAMIAAMNALGYDAGTLGNHEFSHGLGFLQSALAQARFPVVSANLAQSDGAPLTQPHVVLDRSVRATDGGIHPIRIGITGVAPPQTTTWEARRLGNAVRACDMVPAAKQAVTDLRAAGADVVILLAHTGIGEADARPGLENAAIPLAAIPGVDALVLGHTHLRFPAADTAPDPAINPFEGRIHGRPAVMPGFFGSHLGQIELSLRRDKGGWHVMGNRVSLLPVQAANTVPLSLHRAVGRAHDATRDWLRQPIGQTDRALCSHFSLIAPCAALELIAAAQRAAILPMLKGRPESRLPILSAVAPFSAGGRGGPWNYTNIPAGPLQLRHAIDLYPHPNTLVALDLSGADIADWLERAAILFHQITPGSHDAPLVRSDMPSFDFDLMDGLHFRIDLSQPPRFDPRGDLLNPGARRIVGLSHKGRALDPAARFVVVTNSYRAAGSGGFAGCRADRVLVDDGMPLRDAIISHAKSLEKNHTFSKFYWQFQPMPGTSVTFSSAPQANPASIRDTGLRIDPIGHDARGFGRFRLWL